jgi:rhodanese-related sulfurtransferase
VTYDEVQKMIETSEVVFVDARKPFLFEKGHLPNAKNIPF